MMRSKRVVALQRTEETKCSLLIPSVLYYVSHLSCCYSWQPSIWGMHDDKGNWCGRLRSSFLLSGTGLLSSLPMMDKTYAEEKRAFSSLPCWLAHLLLALFIRMNYYYRVSPESNAVFREWLEKAIKEGTWKSPIWQLRWGGSSCINGRKTVPHHCS